eukprot:TRINITY_DN19314_c0_g1_i2.p1 TRINITY_DN19314_c0_g1~~TRINITY_DN19314_c0_g1_i2.p1  ORF type:complete len:149 (+),score=22.00 TRINITY_DN19314_c0_g1_i2:92-538(+)
MCIRDRSVPCGLDVVGLSWDLKDAPNELQRFQLRANPHLCIAAEGAVSGAQLVLQPCAPGVSALQDFNYTHNAGVVQHPGSGMVFCLGDDDAFNRGTVRPWEPATLQPTDGACATSSPNGGADVAVDVELGFIRAFADTDSVCFGVCF